MRRIPTESSSSAVRYLGATILIAVAAVGLPSRSSAAESPETVLVTFHVKQGKAGEFKQLLWRSWATYERLGLVLAQPHIIARSNEENGDITFFELFSWKRHGIPDSAPTEVRELWNQMEALCEPRNGQSGINFVEVEVLPESSSAAAVKSSGMNRKAIP